MSGHAYGVLEVVESLGLRMLLVKNPWGHFRWKGKYSYGDELWTDELKAALGYDNFEQDKGVFWMDFDSVLQWFDCIDVNWNPELLQYRKSFFDHTKAAALCSPDNHTFHDNAQYFINFFPPTPE